MTSSEFNITYLLGAGASANALPTVKRTDGFSDMSKCFLELSDKLGQLSFKEKDIEYVNSLRDNLKWLAEKTNEFGTPDTYAKFLYLKDTKKLNVLKNTLSAYFIFEQVVNQKFDKRILIFLTTILQYGQLFPHNVKILTWNYDFQIELAAEYFRRENFIGDSNGYMHSPPLIGYFPSIGHFGFDHPDEISIIHLNGIAGYYFNDSFHKINSFFENSEKRSIHDILSVLTNNNFNKGNLLSFAWESSPIDQKKFEYINLIAEKTDILVIVGYSFPFFNREIDKSVFNILKANGRLKKIFYQDPFKTGDFIRNQFNLPDTVEIKNIAEKDNYFIPMEL